MTIILIILGKLSLAGKIQPGDFALVFMINYKLVDLILELGNSSRQFVINYGVLSNAIELLDYIKIKQVPKEHLKVEIKRGEIEFQNVSFEYNQNFQIFNNLSVKISAKEKIGLVGYSGSGKSTFINLLLGLYSPSSGKILIDGHDISYLYEEDLNKLMAIVEQEPKLFHRSIADKTSIIVAHRLSTLMNINRIMVFDDGQIVEIGTCLKRNHFSTFFLVSGVFGQIATLELLLSNLFQMLFV